MYSLALIVGITVTSLSHFLMALEPLLHYACFVSRWVRNANEFCLATLQVPFFADMMINF